MAAFCYTSLALLAVFQIARHFGIRGMRHLHGKLTVLDARGLLKSQNGHMVPFQSPYCCHLKKQITYVTKEKLSQSVYKYTEQQSCQ